MSLCFLARDHSVETMHVDPQDRPCRPKQYWNNMRGTDHKAAMQISVNGSETLTRDSQGVVSNPVSSDATAVRTTSMQTLAASTNSSASGSTDAAVENQKLDADHQSSSGRTPVGADGASKSAFTSSEVKSNAWSVSFPLCTASAAM